MATTFTAEDMMDSLLDKVGIDSVRNILHELGLQTPTLKIVSKLVELYEHATYTLASDAVVLGILIGSVEPIGLRIRGDYHMGETFREHFNEIMLELAGRKEVID